MSVGANISVITAGAVLAFATRFHTSGVSVQAVGGVLMLVGLVSLVLQLLSLYRQRELTAAQATTPVGAVLVRPPNHGPQYGPYHETTATPLRSGEELNLSRPDSYESEL
jgi:hypothetical protein